MIDSQELYQEYLNILASNNNPTIELEMLALKYNTKVNKLVQIIEDYINTSIEKPEFAIIFDNLLKSDSKNKYLEDLNITPEYLKQHLKEYLYFYKPTIAFRSNRFKTVIENIIKKYEAYLRGVKSSNKINELRPLFEKFIKSRYNLERFCIKNNISLKEFKLYIQFIKKDAIIYKRFMDSFELKEKYKYEHIEDDISIILKYIYELGDDFCVIDLFQITPFGPTELITFADEYLQGEDLKVFRKYIGKSYRNFYVQGNFMNNLRIEALITSRYLITIDGEEIETTEEFRREVINFLVSKDIPINNQVFYRACIRHYQNNLITKFYR